MKRFLTALIAITYFTISSGVVMSIHYCMGKVSAVEVDQFAGVDNSNCVCGMPKNSTEKKGCCKTEFKVVKLQDNHKASDLTYDVNVPVAVLSLPLNLLQVSTYTNAALLPVHINGPPLTSKQDTYLKNGVFRI